MSDLINREEVLKLIENIKCNNSMPKNYGTLLDIMRAVRKIPTAYDVDKVVEQLQEKSVCTGNINAGFILLKKAIPIVKGGGQG